MKKTFGILGVCFLLLSVLIAGVHAVPVEKFCTDSDGGVDIWTAGYTTDEKGNNYDDCDGASENLKEFTCDDDKTKVNNVKCSDYGAVCISAGDDTVPDYCACDKGYVFDEGQGVCLEDNPEVPEFGTLAAGTALIGALGIFAFVKRK